MSTDTQMGGRMERSEAINELAAALAKAQGQIKNAVKDSSNPFFKSKYADLAGIRDMIQLPLSDCEIAYIQPVIFNGNSVEVTTLLIHSSGQWISSTLSMPIKGDITPQSVGSATTYGRRYGLSAMVGIAQEDDDAETAMGRAGLGNQQAKIADSFPNKQSWNNKNVTATQKP